MLRFHDAIFIFALIFAAAVLTRCRCRANMPLLMPAFFLFLLLRCR